MKSKEDDSEWVWDRNKFFNRKYLMQEMYQNYVEGEDWEKSQVMKIQYYITEYDTIYRHPLCLLDFKNHACNNSL